MLPGQSCDVSEVAPVEAAQLARPGAADLWGQASVTGHSSYLEHRGVQPECCRFLADGSIVIPLQREGEYEEAPRLVQQISSDSSTAEALSQFTFSQGCAVTGRSLRLGQIDTNTEMVLVCKDYITGLSLRMATDYRMPVFVATDVYNLVWVAARLRALYPRTYILVCTDDDSQVSDHKGSNPGKRCAFLAARTLKHCAAVYPVFSVRARKHWHTSYNDLHVSDGLGAVVRQVCSVIAAIRQVTPKVRHAR
jgi:putative DNA primase/helicase